ncbi:methyl-accepting chemotaxis protein [Rhizobium oryzicola]|uniref:Methyl-accepting chemotaxis protein n=1 Tax=Rhizobium oryzicola TaxID=1232668 RepID=A0ABT8SUW1_9HYPH|nr:methyl-accepting chemotaxis protein [Rhizobium oryzicola]MDO1581678.1 methyl-accepting chemotaxis protein [Rhizobium oryzicola]
MSFLANAKIRTKILSLIIPLSLIGIGGVGTLAYSYKLADTAYSDFIAQDAIGTIEMSRTNASLVAVSADLSQAIIQGEQSLDTAPLIQSYRDDLAQIRQRLAHAGTLMSDFTADIDVIGNRIAEVIAQTDQVAGFISQNKFADARKTMMQVMPAITSLRQAIRQLNERNLNGVVTGSDELTDKTNAMILYSVGALSVLFTVGILFSLFVATRGITGPIAQLRARMLSLAQGDTQAELPGIGRKDEIGQMADAVAVFRDNAIERIRLEEEADANRSLSERERMERDRLRAEEAGNVKFAVDNLAQGLAKLSDGDVSYRISTPFVAALDGVRGDFNTSAEKLQLALLRVAENAHAINAGANEMKSSADDLAKRTEQQAAAVEETAAALEEITTTVKDSTRRAQEAGALVARTRKGAEQSGTVVRRAVSAMEKIEKSSSEISSIIGVIDEIAFQTNLLALNAGVEAARAGEAGKGFAVVAQEVRELAQRSATAAKEIKGLIQTSNEQVQEGVALVGETGRALEVIVAEVQEINQNVLAIVEAAQEQSSGLQQINTAVNQMDQDTQKNAAMVEETTAASHSLATEVASLNHMLSQFDLGLQAAHAPAQPAPREAKPVRSAVHALGRKVAGAFSGNAALAVNRSDWEEF